MKMNRMTSAGVLLCASSLAFSQPRTGDSPPPIPVPTEAGNAQAPPPTVGEKMQSNGGSLLRATLTTPVNPAQSQLQSVSFFAVPQPEPRTLLKHDLVTIIVREESEYSSEGTIDVEKEAQFEAAIEEWIKLSDWNLSGGGVSPPVPRIRMNGARSLNGDGSVDREDSLIMRVTAEVVDVKPNGTLVLQARQRIQTDEEVQTFVLTGICRAEDVTPDNTILSTQMFDKNLSKTHVGAVRDSTKRGWLARLLDVVSPF